MDDIGELLFDLLGELLRPVFEKIVEFLFSPGVWIFTLSGIALTIWWFFGRG